MLNETLRVSVPLIRHPPFYSHSQDVLDTTILNQTLRVRRSTSKTPVYSHSQDMLNTTMLNQTLRVRSSSYKTPTVLLTQSRRVEHYYAQSNTKGKKFLL